MLYSPNRDEYFAVLMKERPLTAQEMEDLTKKWDEVGMPVTFNAKLETGEIQVVDDDMKNWMALENRHAEESWEGAKSFMEKYGTYIAVFLPCMLIVVGMYLMSQQLAATAASLSGVTTQLSELIKMLTSQGIKVVASVPPAASAVTGTTGGLPAPPV